MRPENSRGAPDVGEAQLKQMSCLAKRLSIILTTSELCIATSHVNQHNVAITTSKRFHTQFFRGEVVHVH